MESPAGLHYRFEGAAIPSAFLKQKVASRARQYLVELERSEQLYLVTGGEAIEIWAQLCRTTKKDPHWTLVPFGSFFFPLTDAVYLLAILSQAPK